MINNQLIMNDLFNSLGIRMGLHDKIFDTEFFFLGLYRNSDTFGLSSWNMERSKINLDRDISVWITNLADTFWQC